MYKLHSGLRKEVVTGLAYRWICPHNTSQECQGWKEGLPDEKNDQEGNREEADFRDLPTLGEGGSASSNPGRNWLQTYSLPGGKRRGN